MDGYGSLPHVAVRPVWNCAACGEPWPCEARRGSLVREHGPGSVAMLVHLAMSMVDAAEDLRDTPAGVLRDRFVGWAIPAG